MTSLNPTHSQSLIFAASPDPKRYAKWRERGRILKSWRTLAGKVAAEAEARRDFDVPVEGWSSDRIAERRELANAIAAVRTHVAVCRGDGIRCGCQLLTLGLSAFRTKALDVQRRDAARLQRFVLYVATSAMLVLLFRHALQNAAALFGTGTDVGAFAGSALAGIAAGLIVAGMQSALAAVGQVAEHGGERLARVGHHPDGTWIFLSGLVPVWRSRVRRSRLQRDLAAWEELFKESIRQPQAPDRENAMRVGRSRLPRYIAIAVGVAAGAAVAGSALRRAAIGFRVPEHGES